MIMVAQRRRMDGQHAASATVHAHGVLLLLLELRGHLCGIDDNACEPRMLGWKALDDTHIIRVRA